jgi:hypothetical protein
MRKRFRQPLLVRGRRLDEPGVVGFSGPRGRRPFVAMQFAPRARAIDLGRFKALGLTVWANEPGCYGLQLDGKTFSRVVVSMVQLTPGPSHA